MSATGACALLDGAALRRLLAPAVARGAIAAALSASRNGDAESPLPLHVALAHGGFHAKAARLLRGGRDYFALKLNGNFPGNPERHGLPTIQGVAVLADANDGRLLALLDSIALTTLRTAATSALAADRLARADASRLLLVGCGAQAEDHLLALGAVRSLAAVRAVDLDSARAEAFAARMRERHGIAVDTRTDLAAAARDSDLIVTLTPARTPFLDASMVTPGSFVAAVGADHPQKNEIAAELMAAADVVVDSIAQCLAMGDLRHAIAAGRRRTDEDYAELAAVVAGDRPGRVSEDTIVVFDSTGSALEDVACAAAAFERANDAAAPRFDFATP